MGYIAGYNMAGYMPDVDVMETDTFEDAKSLILDELAWHAEMEVENGVTESAKREAEYTKAMEYVRQQTKPFEVTATEYVYWVSPSLDTIFQR